MIGREPGVRVTKPWDPMLWRWGAQFLTHCTPAAHARNTEKLQRLSRMSRDLTERIETDLGLTGTLRHEGGLYLFSDAGQFADHSASVAADGQIRALTTDALVAREPALTDMSDRLVGGLFSPLDSVGDCHLFTRKMANILAEKFGVEFLFETAVTGFDPSGRRIAAAFPIAAPSRPKRCCCLPA